MKITAVDVIATRRQQPVSLASGTNIRDNTLGMVVIVVRTDEGIDGHGFAWGAKAERGTADFIAGVIRPVLLGENPLHREKLWHKVRKADRWFGLMPFNVHGPVDVALWDIAGKYHDAPICDLIGRYRDRLPAYASSLVLPTPEDYAKEALHYRALGYTAYKLHPPGTPEADVAACAAVRAAVGDTLVLMSDPVAAYNYTQALWVGRELEKLNYHWLEEPLSDFDLYGYAKLCRDLDIPIAAAESTPGSVTSAAQYITNQAVDIMRSDVSWKSGITGLLKTAHLCEAFGMSCEIHTTTLSLMEVANLHVACAIPNCEYAEVLVPASTFEFGIKQPLKVDADGTIALPPGPGLGVELDWDAIDNATVERR